MGQIEVSDILLDPDFVDQLVLIHRKPCVNEFGQNSLQETAYQTYGCVQPISGKTLQRLPDALRIANVKSFWIQGKIVSDGTCQYPDVIVSCGVRYAVQMVFDWTNWGAGWSEGTCVQERPTL
jgi:hypothetical protein